MSCIRFLKIVLTLGKIVKRLSEFIGLHYGQNIIVCGCGTSLLGFDKHHSDYITIGVNDVPRLFEPTYMLVTDHQGRFQQQFRKDLVNNSKAKRLFTCASGWRHPNMVHFELGEKALKNLDSYHKIDHFVNSPYVAVNLAYKLGARNIGIIGVDFNNGHFYNPNDGKHPVLQINYLKQVKSAYSILHKQLKDRGVGLYDLSLNGQLDLPKITLEEFSKFQNEDNNTWSEGIKRLTI